MEFKTTIKPKVTFEAKTKAEIYDHINKSFTLYSNEDNEYYVHTENLDNAVLENIMVVNFEKVSKKTKQFRKNGIGNKQYDQSYVLREKHWIARFYFIPLLLAKMMNLNIVQGARSFSVTEAK